VNEVITTILLNFIALYLVSYAVEGPLQEAARNYPQSDLLHPQAMLWRLDSGGVLHVGVPLGFAIVPLVGFVMLRTSLGLRLRASGLNMAAARVAGFPVTRDLVVAFAFSGALAGLAGAVEVAGVTGRLYERFSPGYGYTAIAIALLGALRAGGVIVAACFFAALSAGASAMERSAGVSSVLVVAVQGCTLLAVGLLDSRALRRIVKYLPWHSNGGGEQPDAD
jgi:simple sugar transport system permease protein